ncbi:hypothetical protein ACWEQL_30735 [Kitasatospora sp. NPDC004240]
MLHHSLHKLREADLLREAERERAVRALRAATEGRSDPAGSARRRGLVPALVRRWSARA